MHLTPAYGRDYTTRAQLLQDFFAEKDFIISEGPRQTYINAQQIPPGTMIQFRYAQLRKTFVLRMPASRRENPRCPACAKLLGRGLCPLHTRQAMKATARNPGAFKYVYRPGALDLAQPTVISGHPIRAGSPVRLLAKRPAGGRTIAGWGRTFAWVKDYAGNEQIVFKRALFKINPHIGTWRCDCEHTSHFDDRSHGGANRTQHPYGAYTPMHELLAVKTDYGTFHLCKECRTAGHMQHPYSNPRRTGIRSFRYAYPKTASEIFHLKPLTAAQLAALGLKKSV